MNQWSVANTHILLIAIGWANLVYFILFYFITGGDALGAWHPLTFRWSCCHRVEIKSCDRLILSSSNWNEKLKNEVDELGIDIVSRCLTNQPFTWQHDKTYTLLAEGNRKVLRRSQHIRAGLSTSLHAVVWIGLPIWNPLSCACFSHHVGSKRWPTSTINQIQPSHFKPVATRLVNPWWWHGAKGWNAPIYCYYYFSSTLPVLAEQPFLLYR